MKQNCSLFIFVFLICSPQNSHSMEQKNSPYDDLLKKPVYINPRTSNKSTTRFKISFHEKNQDPEPNAFWEEPNFFWGATFGLFSEFPSIGVYASPYNIADPIGIIKITNDMLYSSVPALARNYINGAIYPFIIIWETSSLPGNTYNMIFHGIFSTNYMSWNQNVPMGVFNANGIKQPSRSSISFGSCNPVNVHTHNAISPNNAHIEIEQNRSVATFWSIANFNGKCPVTLHVVFKEKDLKSTAVNNNIKAANSIGDLLTTFNNFQTNYPTLFNDTDQKALNNLVQTIKTMLKAEAFAKPMRDLNNQLGSLTRQLNQLNTDLQKIAPTKSR